ncbi:hypothetical protein GGS23DRAFT_284881 [Durotheca rogersii]|uniref:uncharacterized protein n=1 Tax=Durotheca rogersii TaxID=419775 RepID=UPI00221F49C1|nr:uncharacterized protein GGS23DRAFT_284881 [Durotheca rogersii]KAI5866728.1 hypothetical protein GGS23DRAFT_284881 [Durotheca rogersii]
MAVLRHLPSKHNPLMIDDIPPYNELVSRRRLGQTQLTAKMVAAGAAGDIDPSSLGVFDYAHLRAPLPKGINSGIFKSSPNSYFLMRRSQDGFVSATGMFKATFPYAEAAEEEMERKYIKSLPTTSHEETAGNVWISPEQALVLAEEYRITTWIRALLDSADIAITNNSENPPKRIAAPPKFETSLPTQPVLAPPTPSSLPRSTRARRSASPAKKRAIASPRKRSTKVPASQFSPTEVPSLKEETESMANGFKTDEDAASTAATEEIPTKTVEKEALGVFASTEEEPEVQIRVGQEVEFHGDVATTQNTVEAELAYSELPNSEDTARMIEEAEEMVRNVAAETSAPSSSSKKGKRKADDIAGNEEEEGKEKADEVPEEPRSKKAKTEKTEVQLRKERVRNRALVGLSATLAVG